MLASLERPDTVGDPAQEPTQLFFSVSIIAITRVTLWTRVTRTITMVTPWTLYIKLT